MEEGQQASHSHSPMSGSTSAEGVNEGGATAGRVKVHLMYTRRTQSLSVMIRHVRDLVNRFQISSHSHTQEFPFQVPRDGSDSADPYVKMYLKPDVAKATKQKTKIAKRTLHPTYNETVSVKSISKYHVFYFCLCVCFSSHTKYPHNHCRKSR